MTYEFEADPADYFSTDHLKADLKGRSVRGGAVTMAAQGVRFLLNLASIMVLARLLSPNDFGLVAMVVAVTGFVTLFKDMGLSMATVQRAEITHAQISTLFWINVAFGLVLGIVLACLAVPIAWFYNGEQRLVAVTLVLALGIPISGLGIQHQAVLRRQMRFVALAVVDTVAMLTGIMTAIVLALLGKAYWPEANYWALVAMPLATATTGAAGVWIVCRWRPSGPRRGSGVRPLLSFGGYLTGSKFVIYLARNLDNVLIGRFWGEQTLGFYNQAYRLLMLPLQQINTPISAVAIPVLSRLIDSPERYRAYYRQGILLVVTLGMPIVAFSFAAVDELVLLVLGPQWTDAVAIFRALAPAAFIGTFNVATAWVFVSQGTTRRQFRAGAVASSFIVMAFVIGLPRGALGVATALSIAHCVIRIPHLIYCFHGTPIQLRDLGLVLWRPAAASLAAAAITITLNNYLADQLLAARFALSAICFGCTYVGLTLALPGGYLSLVETARNVGVIRTP